YCMSCYYSTIRTILNFLSFPTRRSSDLKLTVNGNPHFGMGFYTRAGSESAIIAVKGKPKIASHGVRAVRSAVIGRHSEKPAMFRDRKSTRLNSSHVKISYAVFCLKKKKR